LGHVTCWEVANYTDVAKTEEMVMSNEKRNMNFLEVSAC